MVKVVFVNVSLCSPSRAFSSSLSAGESELTDDCVVCVVQSLGRVKGKGGNSQTKLTENRKPFRISPLFFSLIFFSVTLSAACFLSHCCCLLCFSHCVSPWPLPTLHQHEQFLWFTQSFGYLVEMKPKKKVSQNTTRLFQEHITSTTYSYEAFFQHFHFLNCAVCCVLFIIVTLRRTSASEMSY